MTANKCLPSKLKNIFHSVKTIEYKEDAYGDTAAKKSANKKR
jgi:hypothetical protein